MWAIRISKLAMKYNHRYLQRLREYVMKVREETEYKETYPKSEKFGTEAFTVRNKEKAITKFYEYSGELFMNEDKN